MKATLEKKLFEAKAVFLGTGLTDTALNLMVFFMFYAVITAILGWSLAYALVLSVISALMLLIYRLLREQDIIAKIEKENPFLDGSLKTAYDNIGDGGRNIIVDDLMKTVSRRMKEVGYSTFWSNKTTTIKIAAIVVLSFIFLSITILSFQDFMRDMRLGKDLLGGIRNAGGSGNDILDLGGLWESSENYSNPDEENKMGAEGGGVQPGFNEGPIPGAGLGVGTDATDIYGNPSSANLYGEEVNMEIHPEYGGEVDVEYKPGDKDLEEFSISSVESAKEYKDYPVEQEELVRKYFEKLVEGEKT